jgi:hypothetical protein
MRMNCATQCIAQRIGQCIAQRNEIAAAAYARHAARTFITITSKTT